MLDRIANGRTDLVFEALATGQAADSKDGQGVSLMQWCAYYGDVSAIRFLLSRGAALAGLGENFDLNGACFHGHWRLCQYLVEQGADVNHRQADTGEAPLHAALCVPNRPAYDHVIRVLLAYGANPNVATHPAVSTGCFMRDGRTKGETPLHRAAAFGTQTALQLLLDAGAASDAKDMNGDSPLAWASWYKRPAFILKMLCPPGVSIHPDAVHRSIVEFGMGWGGMEANLLGVPSGLPTRTRRDQAMP